MAKKPSYWERRFLQTQISMQRHSAKYEAGMVSRLDAAYKSANDDLQKWYARYAKTDGTMDIADAQALMSGMSAKTWQMTLDEFRAKAIEGGHDQELDLEYIKSRVSRLQALQFQMQQHMAEFSDQESPKFQDALASQFDDTYMRTNYNIQMARQQIAANFQTFDDQELAMVVNKPWVGSNFSKRLWKDTVNDLPALLVNNLSQSITLGYSYKRIEREMRNQLQDFSKGVIHRLVITEMAHVSEEATAESYAQMDVQEYTYLATLESHTCEVCRKLDGTHYKTADRKPGVNYPPIHAYCRCTTVPYEPALESLPSRRWMRDAATGKSSIIGNTTYKEWKAEQDIRVKSGIIGMNTSDGVHITDIAHHLVERMLQREVDPAAIRDALANPNKIGPTEMKPDGRGVKMPSRRYTGDHAAVVINPETGNVVTVWKKGGKKK